MEALILTIALSAPPAIVSSEQVNGLWYNVYSDGTRKACAECNRSAAPAVAKTVATATATWRSTERFRAGDGPVRRAVRSFFGRFR